MSMLQNMQIKWFKHKTADTSSAQQKQENTQYLQDPHKTPVKVGINTLKVIQCDRLCQQLLVER